MKYIFINDIFYVIRFIPYLFDPCFWNVAHVIRIVEERLNELQFTSNVINFVVDTLQQSSFLD